MGGVRQADVVLRGGRVYTVDASRSWAQAVAVVDGVIAAVGTDAAVSELIGPGTEVIELRGRLLLPGFIDAHVHVSAGGLERTRCDLSQAHSLEEYLAIIRSHAERDPAGGWITGGGWAMDVFPGGVPSRADLDRVSGDRPVFLANRDHHAAWVNSAALALAGVGAATADPADGRIEREPDGTPAGVLQEGAMDLVQRVVPGPSLEDQVAGILEGQRHMHSLGITGWQEAIVGDYAVTPDCFDAYLEVERRGLLTRRGSRARWWARGARPRPRARRMARREKANGPRFRAAHVKIMQDGVCENFTAAMLAPYLDAHGRQTSGHGVSFFGPAELREAVTAVDAAGFSVHIHAIGDRAVRDALDAVAAARAENGAADRRHQIAHLQVIHPDDLPRFRELSVLANCQPLWAISEPQMTELTLPFLGPERSGWQYPFRSLHDSGAQLCFGSDWPVSSANPLWEIHTAVNRTAPPGYPYAEPDPAGPFLPAQRLGLPAAIAAFTIGSAFANGAQASAGSVEPGKQADLVVLDRDLFACPAQEIALAQVDLTLVDGQVVYARDGA